MMIERQELTKQSGFVSRRHMHRAVRMRCCENAARRTLHALIHQACL
jgi:hypothetical protein